MNINITGQNVADAVFNTVPGRIATHAAALVIGEYAQPVHKIGKLASKVAGKIKTNAAVAASEDSETEQVSKKDAKKASKNAAVAASEA